MKSLTGGVFGQLVIEYLIHRMSVPKSQTGSTRQSSQLSLASKQLNS